MRNEILRFVLAAALCLSCINVARGVVVASQAANLRTPLITFQAPEFSCLTSRRTVSGLLEIIATGSGEDIFSMFHNVSGKIVMISSTDSVPRRVNGTTFFPLLALKAQGAAGILAINTLSKTPGLGETILASEDQCSKLDPVMLFEITGDDAARLQLMVAQNNSVFVEASPADVNQWREIRNGWFSYLFRFFFGLFSGITAIAALYKLIAYVATFGVQLSVPQFCLFIAFTANLSRALYHSLDPIFFGKVFSGPVGHLFLTITAPANIITTTLLALYWKEILSKGKVKVVVFVSKMKIPFVVVCILAGVVELASSILRGVFVGGYGFMVIITGVIYITILSLLTIFFAVYGAKVLIKLRRSNKETHASGSEGRRRRVVRNATIMVLLSSVMNIIWIVGMILIVIPSFFYTPVGFHLSWVIVWLGVIGAQLSQVLAFKTPLKHDSSSRGSGSDTTESTKRSTPAKGNNASESPPV